MHTYNELPKQLLIRGKEMGGISAEQAFAEHEGKDLLGKRGLYPMSMARQNKPRKPGAAAAAWGLEQEEEGQKTRLKSTQETRGELESREEEMALRWFMVMTGGKEITGNNKEEALNSGRELVDSWLRNFYNLS